MTSPANQKQKAHRVISWYGVLSDLPRFLSLTVINLESPRRLIVSALQPS